MLRYTSDNWQKEGKEDFVNRVKHEITKNSTSKNPKDWSQDDVAKFLDDLKKIAPSPTLADTLTKFNDLNGKHFMGLKKVDLKNRKIKKGDRSIIMRVIGLLKKKA